MSDGKAGARVVLSGKNDPEQVVLESIKLDDLPTVVTRINSLVLDDSPRRDGGSDEHVRVLAESEEQLPPIVVHGTSMRVIDGMHRVRAAIMRGAEEIEAKIYHGTEDEAFVLAVRMNITHGLPLTRADRTAAAIRIIESHPQWSNRMVATVAGLAAGTIGRLRRRSTVQNAQSTIRVGKDGRARPVDTSMARLRAAELLTENPTASIRATAREVGLSPSTVHDVRRRLRAGEDPAGELRSIAGSPSTPPATDTCPKQGVLNDQESADSVDAAAILANLKGDPSLRYSAERRSLVQYLVRCRVATAESHKIAEIVPDHCAGQVAKLLRGYALAWTKVAVELEARFAHRTL